MLMILGAVLGAGVAVLAAVSIRSDVQIIIALIGLFSAFILLGIAALMGRLKP
jgi:uncharacterized membrane protein (GlpM family)